MPDDNTRAVALVTGATRGLGLETARQLARRGLRVLLGCRNPVRGREAADLLRSEGLTVQPIRLDVTAQDTIDAAAAEVRDTFGRLDVLVNNAGIHPQRAVPSELIFENLRRAFDTNFFGAFATTQALLPLLRESNAGRIVNVSTRMGSLFHLSDPSWEHSRNAKTALAYGASKAALNVLTITLAEELRGTTIKVNAAEPGYTATDFNQHRGTKKPQDAVRIIVELATLPADGPTGGFFDETGRVPW